MTVRLLGSETILLEGKCPSDDAEVLLQHLLAQPGATVDWAACESAHTAVIQVLLAVRPRLAGPPSGDAARQWLYPLFNLPSP